jgi:hypothetical protein
VSPERIRLDLNDSEFQEDLFELPKQEQVSVLGTLNKLSHMTWDQLYRDSGLKWEAVKSKVGPHGGRLYTFRMGKGFRAIAYRKEEWLKLLSLHPDHDSAYDR